MMGEYQMRILRGRWPLVIDEEDTRQWLEHQARQSQRGTEACLHIQRTWNGVWIAYPWFECCCKRVGQRGEDLNVLSVCLYSSPWRH